MNLQGLGKRKSIEFHLVANAGFKEQKCTLGERRTRCKAFGSTSISNSVDARPKRVHGKVSELSAEANEEDLEQDAVGRTVLVHWDSHDAWYRGRVARYDARLGQHLIKYDDRDETHTKLWSEHVVFEEKGGWVRATKEQDGSAELQDGQSQSTCRAIPDHAVGRKLFIYWPDDLAWYRGRVHSWNPRNGKRKIFYDDGYVEDILLSEHRVLQFCSGPFPASGIGGSIVKEAVSRSSVAEGNQLVGLKVARGGSADADCGAQLALAGSEAQGDGSSASKLGSGPPMEERSDCDLVSGARSCRQGCSANSGLALREEKSELSAEANEEDFEQDAVGRTVLVHWTLYDAWYRGRVARYDARLGQHLIKYDDGDEQHTKLWSEHVVFEEKGGWVCATKEQDGSAELQDGQSQRSPNKCSRLNLQVEFSKCAAERRACRAIPDHAVGRKLLVYWPKNKAWYRGRVHSWNPRNGKRKIFYDDGQVKDILLSEHRVLQFRSGPSPASGIGGSIVKEAVSRSSVAEGNQLVGLKAARGGSAHADRGAQLALAGSEAQGDGSAASKLGSGPPMEERSDSDGDLVSGTRFCRQGYSAVEANEMTADEAVAVLSMSIIDTGNVCVDNADHADGEAKRKPRERAAVAAKASCILNSAKVCPVPVQIARRKRVPRSRDPATLASIRVGNSRERQSAIRNILPCQPSAVDSRGKWSRSGACHSPSKGNRQTVSPPITDSDGQREVCLWKQGRQSLGTREIVILRSREGASSPVRRPKAKNNGGPSLPPRRISPETLLLELARHKFANHGSGVLLIEVRYKGKSWEGQREVDGKVLELLTGELYSSTRQWVENCRLGVRIP